MLDKLEDDDSSCYPILWAKWQGIINLLFLII